MDKKDKVTLRSLLLKDELSLFELSSLITRVLRENLRTILFVALIVFIPAFLIYSLSPVEYESKSVVFIESKSANSSANMMKDLLTGTKSESNEGMISPDNYKAIVTSQVFLNELVDIKFPSDFNSKDSLTLVKYFNQYPVQTPLEKCKSLFSKSNTKEKITEIVDIESVKSNVVLSTLNRDVIFSNQIPPIVRFSNSRLEIFSKISGRIKLETKDKTVTVLVKMPSPFLSAIVGKLVLERLLVYISSMETYKQKSNIDYLSKRLSEAEFAYKNAQRKYAGYNDNTLGVIFESAQINKQILSNELSVAFNLYNQFTVQLEQSKVDLKKETPYFSILEPISIPTSASEPNLKSYLFISTGIFLILTLLLLIVKMF